MMLGRIILLTKGEHHSMIPERWLTKIFVVGDVASFMMQGAGKSRKRARNRDMRSLTKTPGGGIMASGTIEAMHTGERIIIGGLVLQLLFFGFFVIVSAVFHARLARHPTRVLLTESLPWERQLYALYAASGLILVRSIFRLVEYAQGNDGYLISHEVFLYIFDAVLMWAVMAVMAWFHPSEITARLGKGNGKVMYRLVGVYELV
jgi:tellurite resistance protein TehA-like permease